MINITVWSNTYVDIENKKHEITNKGDMVILLKAVLDATHYSGERICLESATFNEKEGKAEFTTIERWPP